MTVISICFFAILAAILSGVIAPIGPKFKILISTGAGIVFFFLFFRYLSPVIDLVRTMTEKTGSPALFSLVFKGIAISFLFSLCSSFCRDLGEEAIASKLEMCGKGAIVCLSLPVLQAFFKLLEEVMV